MRKSWIAFLAAGTPGFLMKRALGLVMAYALQYAVSVRMRRAAQRGAGTLPPKLN